MSLLETAGTSNILFVVAAPSGTGKSTLVGRLLEVVGGLQFAVSHTTRAARAGEVDGREYYFVTDEEFRRRELAGEFLESATVHGRRYGTSRSEVERIHGAGEDALLDLDVQGAASIQDRHPDTILVFLLPPDFDALAARLRRRGTSGTDLETRLGNARAELSAAGRFDYVIVNDRIDPALTELVAIVQAERCRRFRREHLLERVAATFSSN